MGEKTPSRISSSKISIPLKNGGMSISVRGKQITMAVVYLLIDCSSSMSGRTKLQQAKDGAKKFAQDAQRKGYSIGLIKFSSDAVCLFDPKQQKHEFNLNSRIDGMSSSGTTNMTEAIEIAIEKLDFVGSRAMLIATDGYPDNEDSALNAAQEAKSMGIEILTIGTDDADIRFLRRLATSTELANKVPAAQFENAISSMADRLALPSGKEVRKAIPLRDLDSDNKNKRR